MCPYGVVNNAVYYNNGKLLKSPTYIYFVFYRAYLLSIFLGTCPACFVVNGLSFFIILAIIILVA